MRGLLTVAAGLVSALALTACGGLSGPVGLASCQASDRGECGAVNDKTLFVRKTAGLVYYHPNGTYYQLGSTQITKGQWQVDNAGSNLITRLPSAGTFPPLPISQFGKNGVVLDGDPAGLSANNRGSYIVPYTDRPLNDIIEQVRAR